MSRKRGIFIAVVLLAAVIGGNWWSAHVRKSHEQQCQGNMALLHSASMSACMEYRTRPDVVLNINDVANYVPPKNRICPDGQIPYSSFSVLQGPLCPHGHQFLPGEKRPLNSSVNVKLPALYKYYGFTNLIVNTTGGSQ